MNGILGFLGRRLAKYLSKQLHEHGSSPATPPERLLASLMPGDVLLVEGHSRISTAIKYLTQSTWSHAALYVGPRAPGVLQGEDHCFVEADLASGVRSVAVGEFDGFHTRICRPVGLNESEREAVATHVIGWIGHRYDLRNVIDLARYLMPTPPVPGRLRRRMISLGSGDPTRAICSTLIAQAFEAIRYPVLPGVAYEPAATEDCPFCVQEVLAIRQHSLYAPQDFDVSPYFHLVKPTIAGGVDFRALAWQEV